MNLSKQLIEENNNTLSREQVAEILGISPASVSAMIRRGGRKVKGVKHTIEKKGPNQYCKISLENFITKVVLRK